MTDHKPEPVFRGLRGTVCRVCEKRVVRHRRGRYAGTWRHQAYPWGWIRGRHFAR